VEHKYKQAIAVGYTVTEENNEIEDVHLIVPSLERSVSYRSANRGKDSNKLPVCGAVANFIAKNTEALDEFMFVGFLLSDFLKRVGLGCAKAGVYFPPDLWLPAPHYGVSGRARVDIDLHPILFSSEHFSDSQMLSYLGGQFSGEDKKSFDKLVKGWEPLQDAERDGKLSFLLGSMFRVWG